MLMLPLYHQTVAAGFPSPAEDHASVALNLHELLVKHPNATFFVRASGSSMAAAGIHDDDILVVDRSLSPAHGNVVVAILNGEMVIKRLCTRGAKIFLTTENPRATPIEITQTLEFHIWGVVTSVIHIL